MPSLPFDVLQLVHRRGVDAAQAARRLREREAQKAPPKRAPSRDSSGKRRK